MIPQIFFHPSGWNPAAVEFTSLDFSMMDSGIRSFMQLSVVSGVVVFLAILR